MKRERKITRPAKRSPAAVRKLDDLRSELAELAFTLERRNRHDAADVVTAINGRIGEIADSLVGESLNEPAR